MDKITKLYENCKDYEKLKIKRDKRYKRKMAFIEEKEELLLKIADIENELDITNRYEEDLKSIEKEIQKLTIINKSVNNLDDLDNIHDDELFALKCKVYVDNLVCVWQENEENTIVVNKSVKPFFEKIRNHDCYKECRNIVYNKLKSCLDGFLFTNVKFEEQTNEIYISKGVGSNLVTFFKNNKELSNFIFNILLNNLRCVILACLLQKDTKYKDIFDDNNNKIRGTKFYITKSHEFIDTLLLKAINELASRERKDIKIDKNITEHNFSEEFTAIMYCINNFNVSPENQIIEVVFLNFFDIDKIKGSLFSYFCIFSEVTYFSARYKFKRIDSIKERLCELIIKNMEIDKVKFGLEFEQQKLTIGTHFYAFKEVLEFFITDTTRIIFIAAYFDELCEKFYQFVLGRKNITIQEAEMYVELKNYVFEISGIEKTLNSYCKMNCLESVLGSNLVEIEANSIKGSICLNENDVCALILALFDYSEKRNDVIKKIKDQ